MHPRRQVLLHEKYRGIRGFFQAGVGDPDLAKAVHEPEKPVGAVQKVFGAHPPHPAAHFSPGGGPGKGRGGGQQPRHQVAGDEQVHFPAQPTGDIGKGHQLHPAALVLGHGDHIEVVRPKGQRPTIQFHGQAAACAEKLGARNIALSLTHTREEALAHVILES